MNSWSSVSGGTDYFLHHWMLAASILLILAFCVLFVRHRKTIKLHIPFDRKALLVLFLSVVAMLSIPTVGLALINRYLGMDLAFLGGLGRIWASPYECASRLWLLGSFVCTSIVTIKVIFEFLVDKGYDDLRNNPRFRAIAFWVLVFSSALPFLGEISLFIPLSMGGLYTMKALALVTALFMFIVDSLMLGVVKDKSPRLKEEFRKVVWMIDFPVVFSIAIAFALSPTYEHVILPVFSSAIGSNTIFVHGLGAGAVAVEIWFANFLFFYLLNEAEKDKPHPSASNSEPVVERK